MVFVCVPVSPFLFIFSIPDISSGVSLDPRVRSVTEPYIHNITRSSQGFQPVLGREAPANLIGRPVMHMSALLHASGEARYTDDIPHQEGELHAGLVMSTHAHANISVDWTGINNVDGIHGYVAVEDIPGSNMTGIHGDEMVFADGNVTHIGQVIGMVLASNQILAQQATKLVQVSYTDLPAVITIEVSHK